MTRYIRYGPQDKFHAITGELGDGLLSFCCRFFAATGAWMNRIIEERPPDDLLCLSCRRAMDHAINTPSDPGMGGMPVSSGRLGTGRRRY